MKVGINGTPKQSDWKKKAENVMKREQKAKQNAEGNRKETPKKKAVVERRGGRCVDLLQGLLIFCAGFRKSRYADAFAV